MHTVNEGEVHLRHYEDMIPHEGARPRDADGVEV